MIVHYRDHTIDVRRERCLGGWDRLYFSVYRDADGYCCVEDGTDGEDTIPYFVKLMKAHIDDALASDDPWGERAYREEATARGIIVS